MTQTPRGRQLAEWVERWNVPLKRFLGQRIPERIDAEDLAQEVYLRLLRVKDLDAIREPQNYLYHVARNIASEWRSRARQAHPHSPDELDELVEFATPESLASDSAQERVLSEVLLQLPVVVRATIYLKLRDGKTHEEIAAHLGVTTRMVRRYLTEGYAGLRRGLAQKSYR